MITLCAFPSYFSYDYVLDVQPELNGRDLETRHYQASVSSLLWLPLLPMMLWRTPQDVRNAAVDNMITNALVGSGGSRLQAPTAGGGSKARTAGSSPSKRST
jgi:hypothetical protein